MLTPPQAAANFQRWVSSARSYQWFALRELVEAALTTSPMLTMAVRCSPRSPGVTIRWFGIRSANTAMSSRQIAGVHHRGHQIGDGASMIAAPTFGEPASTSTSLAMPCTCCRVRDHDGTDSVLVEQGH